MNKTTKIILIVTGVLALGVGTYFVIRYYNKKKKEQDAKKEVEGMKTAVTPVYKESMVTTKNIWRPSVPKRQSNFSNFSTTSNTVLNQNKNMYENSYSQNILSNAVLMSKIYQ